MTAFAAPARAVRMRARRLGGVAGALVGPAFVAATAYVDPGNVAVNVSAGSRYGLTLLWVVVLANVLAAAVQRLAARLGAETGRSLLDLTAARLRNPLLRNAFLGQALVMTIVTDIAEIVGGALALDLLAGVPPLLGGTLVAAVSTGLIMLGARGHGRRAEALAVLLLLVVAIGFMIANGPQRASLSEITTGLVPGLPDSAALLLVAGIVGATVMPHAIYLHSALEGEQRAGGEVRRRLPRIELASAMTWAGAINVLLLLVGTRFHGLATPLDGAGSQAAEVLGTVGSYGFALGMLASSIVSTMSGGLAGASVLRTFAGRRARPHTARALAVLPALAVIAVTPNPLSAMVWTQVVLSLGVPFALVALLAATGARARAGHPICPPLLAFLLRIAVAVVIVLDVATLVL